MAEQERIEVAGIKFSTLDWETAVTVGQELKEQQDSSNWDLGDFAIMVSAKFGTEALDKWCKECSLEVTTVKRCRDVSKKYSHEEREKFAILSWTHFRAVAGREDRLELLEMSADKAWSVEKLRLFLLKKKENPAIESDSMDDSYDVNEAPIKALLNSGFLAKCDCGKFYIVDSSFMCENRGTCTTEVSKKKRKSSKSPKEEEGLDSEDNNSQELDSF